MNVEQEKCLICRGTQDNIFLPFSGSLSAHMCGGEGSLHWFAEVLLHLQVGEMQFL